MSVKTPSSKPTNIKNELNLMNQWNEMTKLTTEEIEQISLLTNLSISSYDTPTQNGTIEDSATPINNILQYMTWESQIEKESTKSRMMKTVDNLLDAKNVISEMTNLVVEANELFKSMTSSYMFIVDKTTDINRLCKDHISEEHHIQLFSKEIRSRLEVFDSLDGLSIKVTNKNLASNALKFLELLRQLDNSTKYLEKHPNYVDSGRFIIRYKLVLNRGLVLLRNYIITLFQRAYKDSLEDNQEDLSNTDTLIVPLNIQLKYVSPNIKPLCVEMELWAKRPEYAHYLRDIHDQYLNIRKLAIEGVVRKKLLQFLEEGDTSKRLRSSCQYLVSIFETEYELFSLFFTKQAEQFYGYVENLAFPLYNYIRPLVVRCSSIDLLCEIVQILYKEITEEIVSSGQEKQLSDLLVFITKTIEDVQERLIFICDHHLQDEILVYEPKESDIADMKAYETNEAIYPTIEKTLSFLKKLHASVQLISFNGISHLAVSYCLQSLYVASEKISQTNPSGGESFLHDCAIYLQKELAPYNINLFAHDSSLKKLVQKNKTLPHV